MVSISHNKRDGEYAGNKPRYFRYIVPRGTVLLGNFPQRSNTLRVHSSSTRIIILVGFVRLPFRDGGAMQFWRTRLTMLLVLTAVFLSQASMVLGQDQSPETPSHSHFLGYLLTFLMIALGIAAVCRPGHRAEKPKMIKKQLEHKLEQMAGAAKKD